MTTAERLVESLAMVRHFAHTRWRLDFRERDQLLAWQTCQLTQFLTHTLPRAPHFRDCAGLPLDALPTMDKARMMAHFDAYNTRGVRLDDALEVALRAETSRDFAPTLGDLTVGLSSGTSGNRGVFLVSPAERQRWAGILLARVLTPALFSQVIRLAGPALRIGFFLRANSNLYTTLGSRRIQFDFFDLLQGVDAAVPRLNARPPDLLVGPPSLLRALATCARAGTLRIQPRHVIAVAEVLEARDSEAVEAAWGLRPHPLYQATEGFLAYPCEHGTLHLNECFVHIEPDWLDTAQTRFQPVITDFTRSTQLIVRYRLNDVLRVRDTPCPCGRAERAIAAIEGRADEVLWLPARASGARPVAIFPDALRRAMLLAGPAVREYRLCQDAMQLTLTLDTTGARNAAQAAVQRELDTLWRTLGALPPTLVFQDWSAPAAGAKRRRVHCARVPDGVTCTF